MADVIRVQVENDQWCPFMGEGPCCQVDTGGPDGEARDCQINDSPMWRPDWCKLRSGAVVIENTDK